jgi:small-conductance mechanosensitive channel
VNELWTEITQWTQHYLGLAPTVTERIVWTVVVWLGVHVLRLLASRVVERRVAELNRRYTVGKTSNYVLGIAGFVATLMIWFGNVTGWAAYLGILSAGLAVALQIPLTNLAGWIFITVRKPFIVGDRIEIGGLRGDVIDMRLFQFTLVEIGNWVDSDQSTGRIVHIPNGLVFRESTANYTAGFNFIWNELPITVTFESDWEKAKRILSELAEKHSILNTEEARNQVRRAARKYMIYFEYLTPIVWTAVADQGVTLTIRYICEPRKRRSTATALWEDVLRAFAKTDDIDFAYPTTRFYDNAREGKPGARAEA